MPGISVWEAMDYSHADETLTYEELSKIVDEEWKSMDDLEKFCRIRDGDPTWYEFIFSSMKKGETVELNSATQEYKIKT